MKGLQLLATGGALPGRVVTNEDLRRQVDTSDEWITTRTGICQRYYCTENEDAATLAVTAARQALTRSGLAASDIACFASQQLGCKLSGGLPFILADHLQFAVQRDDDQLSAPTPLEHEVAFIYPRELQIGQAALAIVQKHTGAKLGQNEATSIALPIVNAEVDGMGRAKDMDFIMKSTRVLDEVTQSVEKQLGCSLDTASYCYIRFLAHLRFLVRRLCKGKCTQTENSSLI